MQNQGRPQNRAKILQIKKLQEQGMTILEIAKQLNISRQLAYYFSKQKLKDEPQILNKSISSAFFKAPTKIQKQVAELLNLTIKKVDNSNNIILYKQLAGENKEETPENNNLITKVKAFLTGKISNNSIDLYFNEEEQAFLRTCKKFTEKFKSLVYGEPCHYTNGEIILDIIKTKQENGAC